MKRLSDALSSLTEAEIVVQRQLDAYNARDLVGWLKTYKADAQQHLLHAGLLAAGHEAIRSRMVDRFNDPALHAQLISRTIMDAIVVDHELVTRSVLNGQETVEMICIYEVHDGLIVKATFAIGQAKTKVGDCDLISLELDRPSALHPSDPTK